MQRVKDLDSIRGLASLAIVVYHLWLSNIGLLAWIPTEVEPANNSEPLLLKNAGFATILST